MQYELQAGTQPESRLIPHVHVVPAALQAPALHMPPLLHHTPVGDDVEEKLVHVLQVV